MNDDEGDDGYYLPPSNELAQRAAKIVGATTFVPAIILQGVTGHNYWWFGWVACLALTFFGVLSWTSWEGREVSRLERAYRQSP